MHLTIFELWAIIGVLLLFIVVLLISIYSCVRLVRSRRKTIQLYTIENVTVPRKRSFLEISNNVYKNYGRVQESQNNTESLNENLLDSTDLSSKFTNSLLRLDDAQIDEEKTSSRAYYSIKNPRSISKNTFFSCSEISSSEEADIV